MLSLSAPTQLQEFAAHSEAVNCLQLGRKSAQVLVSGGDDARVNMWAIGKPNPILSLEGHTSAVECVSFDWNEEVVIAGSAGGQLKLWDLENSKVMRTLAGHRAGCLAVDFHPFGEYFASGSLDTNLKIWDIRKKNCIVTYKGHTKGIEHVRISPDGRWVVSGSQDGMVKLWDLRAGKLMSDFQHNAAVTSMDFHPCYFQLATGCADRTVRVWDLENLQLLHHTPPEATGITSVRFVLDGSHLVTTCRDYLRTRRLEPEHEICDTVRVDWNNFGDLAFNSGGQLVACTMSSTFVGVWLVDLISGDSHSHPEGEEGLNANPGVGTAAATAASGTATAVAAMSAATRSAIPAVPSPPTIVSTGGGVTTDAAAPSVGTASAIIGTAALGQDVHMSCIGDIGPGESDAAWTPAERDAGPSIADDWAGTSSEPLATGSIAMQLRRAQGIDNQGDGLLAGLGTRSRDGCGTAAAKAPLDVSMPPALLTSESSVSAIEASADDQRQTPMGAAARHAHAEVDHAAAATSTFLNGALSSEAVDSAIQPAEDLDVLLRAGHRSVCDIMSARLDDLQKVGALWTQGDVHGALGCMDTLNDDGAAVDVLSVFLRGGGLGGENGAAAAQLLSLDDAVALLPLAVRLASSQQEPHVMMGLEVAQLLLHAFADVIANSRLMQLHNARDLVAAERAEKCARCYEQLFAMRDTARGLTQRGGHCAIKARLYLRAISTHFST
jgi:hypothetical protein